MVQRLLDCPDLATTNTSSLRCIHYASAPMPVPVLRRAIAAFGPILGQVYGMTECIIASLLTPAQHVLEGSDAEVKRLSSAGQAFLGCTMRIVRPDGTDSDIGEIGEILVSGPGLMNGYWNNSTATVAALRGGWMHTGDLGYFDAEYFVFVVDRKKDMIISGGENIYSWEVEEALRAHPAVAEAAVIGVPDPEWGESVKAFVVLRVTAKPSADDRACPLVDRELQEAAHHRVCRRAAAAVQRQDRQEGAARPVLGAGSQKRWLNCLSRRTSLQ
jgi:acyl-CoA synthetase (AMP-forming)/AMP-acid ligase II